MIWSAAMTPGLSGLLGCDDDPSALGKLVSMLSDCAAVIAADIGPRPREALEKVGVRCITVGDDADGPDSVVEIAVEAAGAALVAAETAVHTALVPAELVSVGGVR